MSDHDDEMILDEEDGTVTRRGRGFREGTSGELNRTEQQFDRIDVGGGREGDTGKAARSVEGWIIFVTGVHEEASEEDLQDKFADFGEIKNLHLNLDRRTGFVKGYALIEYDTFKEAKSAVDACDGSTLLEQEIHCDFAFTKPPPTIPRGPMRGGRGGGGGPRQRGRSQSPGR
ncbi:RNA-binding domain-containing protein [Dacryopinax primogenitus]|uniref:RNA-binding domain-containing protein n=1 Tax=Dacryopinax primogenitus (strain DJM 731) TaxID=1858805 RepID=M5FPR8_DACPD|nr:RNA-binding domain-containing protein [Dacryopinax primogenitus]EJT96569.1 RNA-binding domain-containing protein [Dacryopinax primogenitus]